VQKVNPNEPAAKHYGPDALLEIRAGWWEIIGAMPILCTRHFCKNFGTTACPAGGTQFPYCKSFSFRARSVRHAEALLSADRSCVLKLADAD